MLRLQFGTSWADPDEHTMVICGPHAKEARDAIVEYRVSHSDAASYLQSKYPLNQVLLDATFNAR